MTPLCRFLAAACVAVQTFPALAAGDAEVGRALYQTRCAACHSLDFNGVGLRLGGVAPVTRLRGTADAVARAVDRGHARLA